MNAIATLTHEHDVIERVLYLLQQAAADVRAGREIPAGFAVWAIEFIRRFADGCHHSKEEDVLFPLLERRGIPKQGGPIGVMLDEHELGRAYVRRMQAALDCAPPDFTAFTEAAEEYVVLLRQHIFKENNVLFRMAEHCLTKDDAADVERRFHEIEHGQGKCELHRRFEDETQRWEAVFRRETLVSPGGR